ncbi:MAG: hypothetical protein DRR00_02190 [Candidatus Parabeggiatoa sp. nov. 3]|nr:MAG: hypothetical protein DRR00_02190 [Gammaproteobacteria bacterium]RKZ69434.1 MAG: hypothetical protein DRQ99_00855 [Gammaproteobacteria bacterium]
MKYSFCAQKLLREKLDRTLIALIYSVSRLNEVQILFSLQNLFCIWSAKFILHLEYKIYFVFGVQNLFCVWSAKFILRFSFQGVLYSIGKRYIMIYAD